MKLVARAAVLALIAGGVGGGAWAAGACSVSPTHGEAATQAAAKELRRAAAPAAQVVDPRCPQVASTHVAGRVESGKIAELSGLVASRRHPGVYWTHNDSGDAARVFAIDLAGRTQAELTLSNVDAVDIEDIALFAGQGGGPDVLYLADTGNNLRIRKVVQIYRVEEPSIPSQKTVLALAREADVIDVVYDDGARDAETLLVDPVQGDLYLVAKAMPLLGKRSIGVYRLPHEQLRGQQPVTARKVATVELGPATAGDVSPDGSAIVIRNYWGALYWPREPGETFAHALAKPGCELPVADAGRQGEAFAFTADGSGYVTIAEGPHRPIFRYTFAKK